MMGGLLVQQYQVYFENRLGERKEIGLASGIKEALDIIDSFLVEHNYKTEYYIRLFVDDSRGEWVIDVESHTEFFYVSDQVEYNLDEVEWPSLENEE